MIQPFITPEEVENYPGLADLECPHGHMAHDIGAALVCSCFKHEEEHAAMQAEWRNLYYGSENIT